MLNTKKVFLIVLTVSLSSFFQVMTSSAEPLAGIFNRDIKACAIQQSTGASIPCRKSEKIYWKTQINYKGDKKVLENGIDFLSNSFFSIKQDQIHTFIVVKELSENKLANVWKEFIGLKKKHDSSPNRSRTGWPPSVYAPGDKLKATLLPGVPTLFTWGSKGHKRFAVMKDGIELFSRDLLPGEDSITVPAVVLKNPGQYEFVAGNGKDLADRRSFFVVNDKDADLLAKNLKKIEDDAPTPDEVLVNKALYLQTLTDLMPEKWQLDWYACQMLSKLKDEPEIVGCRLRELNEIRVMND